MSFWLALPVCALLQANPYLEDAQKAFDDLHFRDAETKLKLALSAPDSTPKETEAAHDLLARTLLALGRRAEAEDAYVALLTLNANVPEPTNVSPKVKDLFREVKARLYPKGFIRLQQVQSSPEMVVVRIVDPWNLVVGVRFSARLMSGQVREEPLRIENGRGSANLGPLGPLARAPELVVVGKNSEELMRMAMEMPTGVKPGGEGLDPKVVSRPPGLVEKGPELPSTPVNWPAWTTTAVAVVAGAAALGLGVSSGVDYARGGNPDAFASEVLAADNAARSKALAAQVVGVGAVLAAAGAVALWVW